MVRFIEVVRNVPADFTVFSTFLDYGVEETQNPNKGPVVKKVYFCYEVKQYLKKSTELDLLFVNDS